LECKGVRYDCLSASAVNVRAYDCLGGSAENVRAYDCLGFEAPIIYIVEKKKTSGRIAE
jgi:hypothetical protein